ncbi:MAG: hypothetical protein AAF196_09785 [Planctomycetota bacterium]
MTPSRIPFASLVLGSSLLFPTVASAQALTVDTQAIAIGSGQQTMRINAGLGANGQQYLILGSLSGTASSTQLGPLTVPLAFDGYLLFTATNPNNTIIPDGFGTLLFGLGEANFVAPDIPALAGLRFDHSYITFAGAMPTLVSANTVPLTLVINPVQADGLGDGATVNGPILNLAGDVGDFLSGTPGVAVTVNGQPATIDASGFRWELPGFAVGTGSVDLTIRATNAAGEFEENTVTVSSTSTTSNNVVTDGNGRAFLARGGAGFGVLDLQSGTTQTFPSPAGTGSVDDIAYDNGFLFLMDGAGAGNLTVVSAADPSVVVSGPVGVPVGPFSGVSAQGGRVVVSGGTSLLTTRTVSPTGVLGPSAGTIDLGIGQPDAILTAGGTRAIVSVDFAGSVNGFGFGVTSIAVNTPPGSPSLQFSRGLSGAGFSAGSQGPANFPIVATEVPGPLFAVAHGGGLSFVNDSNGALSTTLPTGSLNHATSVGSTVFAVGTNSLVEVDVSSGTPVVVSTQTFPGIGGTFTSVAADANFVVISANGGGTLVLPR